MLAAVITCISEIDRSKLGFKLDKGLAQTVKTVFTFLKVAFPGSSHLSASIATGALALPALKIAHLAKY